jgi:serine/threonine protein kinase/Tol biopolymer transport system component
VIGTTVGSYRVVQKLGEGGMGEVYRATDTNLGRDVAIKVLPGAFAHDAERLARFEREAKTLATLNHPNIAAIYGLERSADATALVMELVEGDTLADRVRRGPLPKDEAIAIAIQIARALEAAHQQGVIHRDLKPANIMVRADGSAKVLDFGLAKMADSASAHPAFDETPANTTRAAVTGIGVVVGTPAYMSPEQASGGPVDARTDIWAFGCVLYEMLTGQRAFARATAPETVAAVLGDSPAWSALPAGLPTVIRLLLQRCLARDRRERIGNAAAVLFLLEERRHLSAGPVALSDTPTTALRRRAGVIIIGLLMAAAGGAAAAFWITRSRSPAEVVRTIIAADTHVLGTDRTFALTPDGSRLAYITSDSSQILMRPLGSLEAVPILKTAASIRGLFASPDDRWFGFVENNFTLRKIAVTGGPPVTVVQMDGPSRGAAWGPNGTIVFATGAADTGLQQIGADGGPVTILTRPDREGGEVDHVAPAWLPDGRGLLFTIQATRGGLNSAKVAVLDLTTGTRRTLIEGGYSARFVGGYLVYGAAGALRATRFDLSRLETQGVAVEVIPGVSAGLIGGVAHFDVDTAGTLVYPRAASSPADEHVLVWVDRHGRETALGVPAETYTHPRLSPDGKRMAVSMRQDIYILDLTRQPVQPSRMTFAPGNDWFPVWTPDGKQLVFGSWRGGGFSNLYAQQLDSGTAEQLTESPDMQLPTAISPDGATVVFHSFTKSLQALRLHSPRQTVTLVESPLEERNGAISPDGRWLAYEAESSSEAGLLDVYVRPFPDANRGVWQVTRGGGMFPLWARNGRELYYVKTDGSIMAVPVEATAASWRVGAATELFRGEYLMRGDGSLGRHHDIAPDGRFVMLKRDPAAAPRGSPHFVVVQHWLTELGRVVPTRDPS